MVKKNALGNLNRTHFDKFWQNIQVKDTQRQQDPNAKFLIRFPMLAMSLADDSVKQELHNHLAENATLQMLDSLAQGEMVRFSAAGLDTRMVGGLSEYVGEFL